MMVVHGVRSENLVSINSIRINCFSFFGLVICGLIQILKAMFFDLLS